MIGVPETTTVRPGPWYATGRRFQFGSSGSVRAGG
jgi:hypothetical protein